MNVKDKIAIITGASSGIGKATAKLLSQNGAKVVLVARSKDKLEKLSKELPNSLAIQTDMADESQIKEMVTKTVKHFGRVDVLINNAGIGYDSLIENIEAEKFRYLFELDLLGVAIAMREVIPYMKKQKEGSIINISSGTALMVLPSMSPYSSLKRAVVGISLTAREELKKFGINVSVVYPYITSTNFEKNTLKSGEQNWEDDGNGASMPGDTAEYIAGKILEAIEKKLPEVFAHDFMGKRK